MLKNIPRNVVHRNTKGCSLSLQDRKSKKKKEPITTKKCLNNHVITIDPRSPKNHKSKNV